MISSFSTQRQLNAQRKRVDKALQEALSHLDNSELSQACRYSVMTPGKRLRPILLLAIAEGLGGLWKPELAAAAVEMFHCASLIADDLPCMDNDELRRGRPAVHKVYGESVALLATYALISEGYAVLFRSTMELGKHGQSDAQLRGLLAVHSVAINAGIEGAAGGQYLDLNLGSNPSAEQLLEALRKKTASLFELSCVLGWLFGGGALTRLEEVKAFAFNLGMAFQILDDIDDIGQDEQRNLLNYCAKVGIEHAKAQALDYLGHAKQQLHCLGIATPLLEGLLATIAVKADPS